MLVARHAALNELKLNSPTVDEGVLLSRLVAYRSKMVYYSHIISPYLFVLYVDKLISQLRHSSYGLHMGQLFVGCAFYADDIALLSASCYELQTLNNICEQYGTNNLILLKPTDHFCWS